MNTTPKPQHDQDPPPRDAEQHVETVIIPSAPSLMEGHDFYMDPITGFMVFTAKYLTARGYCCKSGCRHCPWPKNR